MPRLLVAALPLIAGLLPFSAWALGLGEITLKSALNQPFRAEIPVTADTADELSRLEVGLAPFETFQRFGLDRPAFLADISFTVEPAGARGGVVRISSTRPITEPFVTLLVEARWPAGRLLREYTVLLDPPAFVADGGRAPASLPAAPAPRPEQAEPIRRADPPPAAARTPSPAPRQAAVAGSSYEVRRSDTLWQVASELRPDPSVSVNQMMIALFRANPEAFAGNINRLRAGAILRVPGVDDLRGLAAGEANAEVAQQNAAWRGDQGARLQLVPPAELPPATATTTGTGETRQLQSRVGQLESELAEARRLLSVRDDELRALQAQLAAPGPAVREEPVAPLPPADPFVDDESSLAGLPVDEEPAPLTLTDTADTAPVAAPEPTRTVVRQAPPAGGSLLDTILGLLTSVWLWGAAAVVVALSLFMVRRRREAALFDDDAETGRWNAPREPTIPPAVSTVGGAAGAARGFIVEERSIPPEPVSDISGTDDIGDIGDQTMSAPVLRPPERGAEATAMMGGEGAEAADVIAEADFHMAYGLYDQAADLLNDAIAAEPGRRDLRMKLLEVLFVWENKGAFLRAAQEFSQQADTANDPDWGKVLIMGQQICPEDPLFAGSTTAAVGDGLDFSLDSEEGASTVDFSIDETGSRKGLDEVDLSGIDLDEGDASLDFDVGESSDETGQATTGVATAIDSGRTQETPTLEVPANVDSPTLESPTLQTPGGASPTMETPTIQARSAWQDVDDDSDPTEAIDLDELGLDFSGLDEASDALSTGLHQALDEATGSTGVSPVIEPSADFDFDFSDDLTSGHDQGEDESDADGTLIEPTGQMPDLTDALGKQDLDALSSAMGRGDQAGDTAEHQRIDETAEQPRITVENEVDFDLGEALTEEDFEPTASLMQGAGRLGSDGPTMTEVGTKLDLARAYIDMGDPDGARSILNEVIDEGDAAQRQEARQLLGELGD